ncbi:MAG: DUF1109 family protein [Deltaproteobacteria bacterium]|jgi:hypothetical protein|nr:DUF1109 family protein [Deltaproteobacteria bacterium]
MTGRSTEDLVQQLVRNLRPVKPIARLRVAAAGTLALWIAAVVATGWLTGTWPRFGEAVFWLDPLALAILLGLGVVAAGAVVAALASAVPGRERLVRAGGIGAGIAAVWLIGCGICAVGGGAAESAGGLFAGCVSCLLHAVVLAIPAALAASFYLSRGAPRHRLFASGVAAAGAAGLGALAVHATCSAVGGFHLLLGHCLTPMIAGLVFALPLAVLVQRWSPAAIEP